MLAKVVRMSGRGDFYENNNNSNDFGNNRCNRLFDKAGYTITKLILLIPKVLENYTRYIL